MTGESKHKPENAWEYWYHCMVNTYGTWLPGDPRGFRTRHHREHIEGDYKNPPAPENYQSYRRQSQRSLSHTMIKLDETARRIACQCIVESLVSHDIQVAECSIDAVHFHLLAKFEPQHVPTVYPGTKVPGLQKKKRKSSLDDPPRHYVGLAKKSASYSLHKNGLVRDGPVWGTRGKIVPVENQEHFEYLRSTYLPNHRNSGASLWTDLESV